MPFHRCSAAGLLAACTFVWACPVEFPGREPFSAREITERTELARTPGRTQSELRQRFGPPWIESNRWRVDVFRLSGRQRVWVGVPVPVPQSRETTALTLVTYDAMGRVEAADSGLPGHRRGPIALEAGDFQLVTGWPLPLSVTLRRFLADQGAGLPGGGCTLLIACDPQRPAFASFPDSASRRDASTSVCWSQVTIDDGPTRRLSTLSMETYDRRESDRLTAPARGSREEALIAERGDVTCDGERCGVRHNFFVPARLSAGEHSLRFSAPESFADGGMEGGELGANFRCEEGEVVYATVTGERTQRYSATKQLLSGLKRGTALGRVEVTREAPSQLPRHTVLLFSAEPRFAAGVPGGEWLIPESPAR